MIFPRLRAGIYRYFDQIFVFGGHNGERALEECEVYCISQNKWSQIPSLPEPVAEAVVMFSDGELYIHGSSGAKYTYNVET